MDLDLEMYLCIFYIYIGRSRYDHWGFSCMGMDHDKQYLRYLGARVGAFQNVWWSMANECELAQLTNLHKNRGQAATQLCPALGVQRLIKASLSPSRNGAVSLTLPGWLSSTGSGIGCKCGGRPAASSASLAREHPPPSPHLNNMPGVLEKQDVIITGNSTDTLVVSEEGHGGQCLQGCDDEVYRESRCLFQLSH
jgi:hypothetical protein